MVAQELYGVVRWWLRSCMGWLDGGSGVVWGG